MKIETAYDIGDEFCIDGEWRAVCTAILIRASGQVEYQLEWLGNAEFKSEWLTRERIEILGARRVSKVKG
jgi:hypothetical protein